MSSQVKKTKPPTNGDLRSRLQKEVAEESLDKMLKTVSFRKMPLEERRKEAQKPLFLTRYE